VSEADLAKLEDPDPLLQIPRFQIGKTGVETRMEAELRGEAGNLRIEVSAAGRVMRELGRVEGTPGKDIQLTIDLGLQDFAMRRMGDESASAAVIDVTNGDILALASAPGFDPNSFVFGIKSAEWSALLNDDHRPLSNKTITGTYPPGSTFKICMALAALEAGVVSPGDGVGCGGYTVLGNRRFHCWKRGGHGRVALRESLAQSCDCYYYEMGRRLGPDRISAMAKKLGLGIRHDLPMPAVSEGNMPDAEWKKVNRNESWTTGDSFNYGIGQGFTLASPLQLAVMTARVASGRALTPRLIRSIGGVPAPEPVHEPLDIDPRHLNAVRDGMFAVSNGGTAHRSRIAEPTMQMAGKTGTSQVRIITAAERAAGVTKNEQLPWNRRDHALFVCYAPYDKPRYAVAQIVEHGGGGSAVAAPIARDILLYALYGGMPPLSAYPPEQHQQIEEMQRRLQPIPATGADAPAAPQRDRA
jgi:penicillin-binding protein 2